MGLRLLTVRRLDIKHDLPTLMTFDDIVRYHRGDSSLTKKFRSVGSYSPPSGRPIPLWAAEDIADKCRQGHLLPAPGADCKPCAFLERIGRIDGVPQAN